MSRKRRPRHPPLSPLEQFFGQLKDTVLDFVEDTAYDVQEMLWAQQEAQAKAQSVPPPRPGKRPRTGYNPPPPTPIRAPAYYSVLGVAPDAPQEVVQAAYRALSRIYHPDVPKTGNAEKMKKINRAYEVLKDAEQRAEYNKLFGL